MDDIGPILMIVGHYFVLGNVLIMFWYGCGLVRTKLGQEYCISRQSGLISPKRELQGFTTGIRVEHLAQATDWIFERLGLSLRRETLASARSRRPECVERETSSKRGVLWV